MTPQLIARLSNLSGNLTEAHLREILQDKVKIAKLIMPRPLLWLSCPIGRAEVVGETEEETIKVYAALHGALLDGNEVSVSFVRIDESLPPQTASAPARESHPRHHDEEERKGAPAKGRKREREGRKRSSAQRDSRREPEGRAHSPSSPSTSSSSSASSAERLRPRFVTPPRSKSRDESRASSQAQGAGHATPPKSRSKSKSGSRSRSPEWN